MEQNKDMKGFLLFSDILYGIVISSTFRFIEPTLTKPALIFIIISIIIIFDDWLLYHIQYKKIKPSIRFFATSSLLDLIILTIWFYSFLITNKNYQDNGQYYFWIGVFYIFTSAWEFIFSGATGTTYRGYLDLVCASVLFSFACIWHHSLCINHSEIQILFIIIAIRSLVWIDIVFEKHFKFFQVTDDNK